MGVGVYTGVGSRTTPEHILKIMRDAAAELASGGWVLRSGAASGADSAFEEGCDMMRGRKEIYLPFRGFNGNRSHLDAPSPEAFGLASHYHPHWHGLSSVGKRLMARNMHQVLGADLKTQADILICWTPDGCKSSAERSKKTGGSGQAIDLASDRAVPVLNLFHPSHQNRLQAFVEGVLAGRAGPCMMEEDVCGHTPAVGPKK